MRPTDTLKSMGGGVKGVAGGRGILSGLLPSSGRGRGGLGKGSKGKGAAKLGGYGKNFSTPLRNPKIAKSKAQTL